MSENMVHCQILGGVVPKQICVDEQGGSGCAGCSSRYRVCETCGKVPSVHVAYGLCDSCFQRAQAKGLCETCLKKRRTSRKSRHCSGCYKKLVKSGRMQPVREDASDENEATLDLLFKVDVFNACQNDPDVDTLDEEADPEFVFDAYSVERLVAKAAEVFGVSVEDIHGRSRKRKIAEARQMAMYVMREFSGSSYPEIGKVFCRDHSTVIHAIQTMQEKIQDDTSLYRKLRLIQRAIRNEPENALGEPAPSKQKETEAERHRRLMSDATYKRWYDLVCYTDPQIAIRTLEPMAFKPSLPQKVAADAEAAKGAAECVDRLLEDYWDPVSINEDQVQLVMRYREAFDASVAVVAHIEQDPRVVLLTSKRYRSHRPAKHCLVFQDEHSADAFVACYDAN